MFLAEISRRFKSHPPPGKPALYALLQRVQQPQHAASALDAVRLFRNQLVALFPGNSFTLGQKASDLLVDALLRAGEPLQAAHALGDSAALGLLPTKRQALHILRAAAAAGGADATAAAYTALRSSGVAVDADVASACVLGLRAGEGGSAERAEAAVAAFEAAGLGLAPAFTAMAAEAADKGSAADAERLLQRAGGADGSLLGLRVRAQVALLQDQPQAAAEALQSAAQSVAALPPHARLAALSASGLPHALRHWAPDGLEPEPLAALRARAEEALAAFQCNGLTLDQVVVATKP